MNTSMYILFGAPGSGKGTQSQLLAQALGCQHVSTGHILREQMKDAEWVTQNPALSSYIQECFDTGALCNDETMLRVIEAVLAKPQQGFIFDGFPRTVAQAEALWEVAERAGCIIRRVIHLTISDEECQERLLNRQDNRADDNLETIKERLRIYHEVTAPVSSYYYRCGNLRYVPATGTTEEVFARIQQAL